MKQARKIILIGALVIGVGVAYYVFKKDHAPSNIVTLYGNIDIREADLGFRVFGQLKNMIFEEGDEVKAGDMLAEIDDIPYVNMLNAAKADLEQKSLGYLNSAKIAARKQDLLKNNFASKEDAETAQTLSNQALAAQHQAEAALETAQTNLKDTKLYAPSNGVIISRVEEPGTILNPGSNVYVLSLKDPIWARVYINEPDLGRIYPGMKAKVYTDSNPNTPYEGQIGFISPVAEFTPKAVETAELRTNLVYRLRVIINTPDKLLRQGMPVTVKLDATPK